MEYKDSSVIIALCGYKSSGKDYFADHLEKEYNYEHVKVSNKLKSALKILFDFEDEQIDGSKKENIDSRWNITPRQTMQFLGTEVFQYKIQELLPGCDRNFWIKSLVDNVNAKNAKNANESTRIVISDIRFEHEYDYLVKYLKNYKVIMVRIENDSLYKCDEHCSETEFMNISADFVIHNKLTKEFIININEIMKSLHIEPNIRGQHS